MSARFEAPRGTHDVLPLERPTWDLITREFADLCALYGYRRVDTPVFEDTDLFTRTSGESSDVVRKEMYTFTDRGNRSLTLRPEATAPIVRAYLEHGLHRQSQPVKLYAIETIYRYGRPQKGRFREHWQLDVEAIGSDDPGVDAEVIQLYHALLGRLGVADFHLALNSIGDGECRPAYLARLRDWLAANERDLDRETREQTGRNPLRALDNIAAKPAPVQEVLRQAPAIGDALCEACREHFAEVRGFLDAYGVRYELVPTLVRGLDYYTRTTWEFVGPHEGAQSTLSGGGRYDGLAEELGGKPTPGVGFGAGVERLVRAVQDAHASGTREVLPDEPEIDVFFLVEPGVVRERRAWALSQMLALRKQGYACDTDYARRSRKGQVTQAGRLGARLVVEIEPERVVVRGEEVVPEGELNDLVVRELGE